MTNLEQIYEINFNKINFLERKISIKNSHTILIGPPKSGKSYLIYDYLSAYDDEKYIYIDLEDYRVDKEEVVKSLELFVKENNIDVVVIENYEFDFELPKATSVILSTRKEVKIDGFDILYVDPLDFEEYILFDVKHQNLSHSFNTYLKFGNLPEVIEYSESKRQTRNLEVCKLFCEDKTEFLILMMFIKSSSEKKSIFQLFNTLKKEIKISKDRFYKYCEYLEQNRVIHFCSKYNQPKAVKKIFSYNHALLDIASHKKNFNNLFKNMIFLELHTRFDELYYLDNIDFYLPSEDAIVLAIPFFNNLISSSIISKLLPAIESNGITSVTIVTISSEQTIYVGELEASIVPFYNWVLSL